VAPELPPPPYTWEITRVCAEAVSDARQKMPSRLRTIERKKFGLKKASEQWNDLISGAATHGAGHFRRRELKWLTATQSYSTRDRRIVGTECEYLFSYGAK
jgi:hypothetical protein